MQLHLLVRLCLWGCLESRCDFGPGAVQKGGRPEIAAEAGKEALQRQMRFSDPTWFTLMGWCIESRIVAATSRRWREQALAVMRVVLAVV